ncbi:CHASE domain-containing protein [Croceicoccus bisphenolivorans]|uniref:CHASE domain-containing protein n=1 Tax=Croceicoccus bisphenolivorans TaxID=1783232 RepID=UPI000AD1731C|nr:CHASE domain-containing protein [Croceicoccus bisphenolivorans]
MNRTDTPAGREAQLKERRGRRADPRLGRVLRYFARYPRALPIGIFVAIAALTATGVWAIEKSQREARRNELAQIATAAGSALERRANANAAYLRSGAALIATQPDISPALFQTFVGQLRLDANFRGAEGIGWAPRVDSSDIPQFETAQREAGQDNFSVHPLPRPDQAYAVPVTYLQPLTERNRRALGFNMFSEPTRRDAMLEAEKLSRPTTSGRVVLVQEIDGSEMSGFLTYMPVFAIDRSGARSLKGYVYSPFNAQDFLGSAIEGELPYRAHIQLFDGAVEPDNMLAEISVGETGGAVLVRRINIGNREWTMRVESIRTSLLSEVAVITLLAGLVVASLALAIAWLLTRQAAEARQVIGILEEQAAIRNSLTRELNHRVKNTLANVLSIISLTRRRATDIETFSNSLDGRIRALSATHDLLTQSEWGTTPVRSVVEVEVAPYALGRDATVDMDGPLVELAPNDALSLGLAIHELATNAAKFGALSVPQGRVEIEWDLVSEELVRVRWRESGGPTVSPDRPRGFGTELIEKIVAHELRNPVDLVFEPGGVRCTMLIPVRTRSEFMIRARNAAATDS